MSNYIQVRLYCMFCGKFTKTTKVHPLFRQFKQRICQGNPCPDCRITFKTHKYVLAECGHEGFVKISVLKKAFSKNRFKTVKSLRIFKVEKCLKCESEKSCK